MIKGVTEKEYEIVKDVLKEYQNEYSFYFYGSRVKGNFEKTSDLDILIKGEHEMPVSILVNLKEKFDTSKLPYVVNFSDYNSIEKGFYTLIQNDLVRIV